MTCSPLAAAAFAAALCISQGAHALTWSEIDAGDVPGLAELTTGSLGSPLDAITGRLQSLALLDGSFLYQVDLFGIRITDGAAFSATSIGGNDDTALFLFDSAGRGIYTSDDTSTGLLAALPAYPGLASGLYYLGIAQGGFQALDGTGTSLFQPADANGIGFGNPASGPLDSWVDTFGVTGEADIGYSIQLTGASVAAVPEPSAALMLAFGLGGLAVLRRRARRQAA